MEFFRNPNIPFLKYKWYFLAFSLIFSGAGILSMVFWHGVPLGVDFRGGTLVYVKFTHPPDNNQIRAELDRRDPLFRDTGRGGAGQVPQLDSGGEVAGVVRAEA